MRKQILLYGIVGGLLIASLRAIEYRWSQAEIDAKTKDMEQMKAMLKNPVTNAAATFLEPLPVGVLMALISAGLLSRKRRSESQVAVA